MEKAKILIVDDEKETRHTLHDYLSNRIECEIVEAENGYEAIQNIKNAAFDLILLDIKMPGISGIPQVRPAAANWLGRPGLMAKAAPAPMAWRNCSGVQTVPAPTTACGVPPPPHAGEDRRTLSRREAATPLASPPSAPARTSAHRSGVGG